MMDVAVTSITGYEDAICAMYIDILEQKYENEIRATVEDVTDRYGRVNTKAERYDLFKEWMDYMIYTDNFGLRFIHVNISVRDISIYTLDALIYRYHLEDIVSEKIDDNHIRTLFSINLFMVKYLYNEWIEFGVGEANLASLLSEILYQINGYAPDILSESNLKYGETL